MHGKKSSNFNGQYKMETYFEFMSKLELNKLNLISQL